MEKLDNIPEDLKKAILAKIPPGAEINQVFQLNPEELPDLLNWIRTGASPASFNPERRKAAQEFMAQSESIKTRDRLETNIKLFPEVVEYRRQGFAYGLAVLFATEDIPRRLLPTLGNLVNMAFPEIIDDKNPEDPIQNYKTMIEKDQDLLGEYLKEKGFSL